MQATVRSNCTVAAADYQVIAPANVNANHLCSVTVRNAGVGSAWFRRSTDTMRTGRVIAPGKTRTIVFRAATPPLIHGDVGADLYITVDDEVQDWSSDLVATRPVKCYAPKTTPNTGAAAARRQLLSPGCRGFSIDGYPISFSALGVVYYAVGGATVDCTGAASAQGSVPAGAKKEGILCLVPQAVQWTVGGAAPADGVVYTFVINGRTITYAKVAADDSAEKIAIKLAAALTAELALEPLTVSRAAEVVIVTANEAGVAFTFSGSENGAGTLVELQTAPTLSVWAGSDFSVLIEEVAP